MRTLAERDVKALLSVVAELAALDDAVPFPEELLRHAGDLVGGAEVCFSELDRLRQRPVSPDGDPDVDVDEESRTYFRLAHQHPVCSRRTLSDDWTSVLKVSDFATQRQFERTEIWNELYRAEGVRYWMDVGLEPTGPETRVFIFTRRDRDFDERDRLMIKLLRPHLQQRHDTARWAAEAADALATLEEEGTAALSDVVLCSARGVLEFASPRARRLITTYFGPVNGSLPEELRAALRLRRSTVSAERNGRRL